MGLKKDLVTSVAVLDLIDALKGSKPYTEPTGDLISRSDALKAVDNRHEELLHDTEYRRKHCQIDLLGIKKHILAIPPVEAYTLEDMQNNFDSGVDSVIGKYDKAKGEWSPYSFHDLGSFGDWDYKCSRCNKVNGWKANFCPNCGADMRGGETE